MLSKSLNHDRKPRNIILAPPVLILSLTILVFIVLILSDSSSIFSKIIESRAVGKVSESESWEKSCNEICEDIGYKGGVCRQKALVPKIEEVPIEKEKEGGGVPQISEPPPVSVGDGGESGVAAPIGAVIKITEIEIGAKGCFQGETCKCIFMLGTEETRDREKETSEGKEKEAEACTPNPICGEWSACIVSYDAESIIKNDIAAISWQERLCVDENQCVPNEIQRQPCKVKVVSFKSEEACAVKHLVIVDNETGREVARLRPVFKGQPRFDIEIGEKLTELAEQPYCWYCADGVKDYDETGVDCGGSCPSCSFKLRLAKQTPYLIWILIFVLTIIATFLIWIESKNLQRNHVLTKLKAIRSLTQHKRYEPAAREFHQLSKRFHLGRFKDKEISILSRKILRTINLHKPRHHN